MKNLSVVLIFLFFSLSLNVLAEPVNINAADAQTLAANIKGVGDKKAAEIIRYRETYGPFKTIDELENIKGIGPKLIEKNRSNLLIVNREVTAPD